MRQQEYITGIRREELVEKVGAAYMAGEKSIIKLARQNNLTAGIVTNMLYESGVRVAKAPHDAKAAELHKKIKTMFIDESMDVIGIAARLEKPYSSIYSILYRYGLLHARKRGAFEIGDSVK